MHNLNYGQFNVNHQFTTIIYIIPSQLMLYIALLNAIISVSILYNAVILVSILHMQPY